MVEGNLLEKKINPRLLLVMLIRVYQIHGQMFLIIV